MRPPRRQHTVLQIHPTRRCNLTCAHCYSESGPRVTEQLDAGILEAAVREAAGLGYRQVAVSGGEPFLFRPLSRVLAAARAAGMITSLTTNGTLATPARLDEVAAHLDILAVSLDGTPSAHDALRGAGSFHKLVRNLPAIRRSGIPYGFVCTLTQHNVDQLAWVVGFAQAGGAQFVQVHPMVATGRARDGMAGRVPDQLELMAAAAEVDRLRLLSRPLSIALDGVTKRQLVENPPVVEAAGRADVADLAPILVVEANGTVRPWAHDTADRLTLGSLHDGPLAALVDRWFWSGTAAEMAQTVARAYRSAVSPGAPLVLDWPSKIAAGSHATPVALRRLSA